MLRAALAIIATLLLVSVLALLIVESRSVNEEYYAAHAERMRAIDTARTDLALVAASAESAFREGRPIPDALEAALGRLATSNTVLQAARDADIDNAEVVDQLTAYDEALASFAADADAFAEQQDALAEALRRVQEESPEIVKELRSAELADQSQATFAFALDLIEFASGQSSADPEQLAARLNALNADPAIAEQTPGLANGFVDAAATVIAQREAAAGAVRELAGNTAADRLWELSNALQGVNRSTVSRAERARLLLSVCTLTLLAGMGFVAYRLQASYRELNKSNAELAVINDSLEERVGVRTSELSSAYDELKESQVQLVQAEKMSSLGELVAGISHEINTPLWYLINNATIIQERLEAVNAFTTTADDMIESLRGSDDKKQILTKGLSDLRRKLADGLKDDVDEASDLIRDSIEGLEELTELAQSLKDFSRLDRSQTGQFNVNDGLDKTLLIARNKLKNKVEIVRDFGDVPPIHCSPSQINQIFLNLITNAADAIDEDGEIAITTWEADAMVHVRVADTGSGIPAELLEKIRDPFFTTKEVGKGTGLGMSIVDRIISAHNGSLDIQSEVGKGTSMTVSLPVGPVGAEPGRDGADTDTYHEMPALGATGASPFDEDEDDADSDDEGGEPEAVTG